VDPPSPCYQGRMHGADAQEPRGRELAEPYSEPRQGGHCGGLGSLGTDAVHEGGGVEMIGEKVATIWVIEWFNPETRKWEACSDSGCFYDEQSALDSLEEGETQYRISRYARMENF